MSRRHAASQDSFVIAQGTGSEQSTPHAVRHLRQKGRRARSLRRRLQRARARPARPALRCGLNKSWTQSVRIDGRPTGSASPATLPTPSPWPASGRTIVSGRNPRRSTKTRAHFRQALETVIAIQGLRDGQPAGDAIAAALPKTESCSPTSCRSEAYCSVRLAFELLVLTATRSVEVRHAVGRARPRRHSVDRTCRTHVETAASSGPLSDRALEVLDEALELATAGDPQCSVAH